MRNIVLLLLVLAGCGTKKNPEACCVDEADCAAVGLPAGSTCEDGRSCRNNRCVELPCTSSNECDALEPYCGGDICEPTCSDDAQCPGFGQTAAQKFCEGTCVECRAAADCGTSTPVCDAGTCRQCGLNDECASGACTADGSCADEMAIAYVAPTGSASAQCRRDDPCSFARAIDPGINRRYVVLAAGNYQLTTTVVLDGLRSFIGAKGARPTIAKSTSGIILQLGSGADITFDNVEVRGATKSAPTAVDGIGIDCPSKFQKSSLRLTRTLFSQNQSGGVFARQCNLEVSESTFVNNERGLEATDVMGTIERSTFANNLATGLILDGGLYKITNNFMVRNLRGSDIYVSIAGSTFEFNTVADNSMVGVSCQGTGTGDFKFPTNLITGNGTNVETTLECNFNGSMIIAGDTAHVKYKSPTTPPYDYHLTAGSSAVDQITTSTQVRDFDGETRPYGAGHDFGADELH
jgi:Periplasmic copper-binding protein (NosD)